MLLEKKEVIENYWFITAMPFLLKHSLVKILVSRTGL